MDGRKSGTKFTVQFNRSEPSHLFVADLLNKQGFHGKAQYIVDAVLHYESVDGKPELKRPMQVDEKYIEVVVKRLLQDGKIITTDSRQPNADSVPVLTLQDARDFEPVVEIGFDEAMDALGEDGFNAVTSTLDMFRKK